MKVSHVIGSAASRYGGPQRFVKDVCRGLASRGHDVTLITTDLDGPGRIDRRALQAEVGREINLVVCPVTPPIHYAFSPALVGAAKSAFTEADVVHIHGLYQFHSLVAGRAARRIGKPYVLHPHGALTRYHRSKKRWKKRPYELLVERRNLSRAAAIVHTTVSESVEFADAFNNSHGVVVPYPVDPALLNTGGWPRSGARWDSLRNTYVVLFLGRISEKKGLDVLVEAFARVAVEHDTAQLVVAGPDDEGLREDIERRVARHGISHRVAFPGLVTGAEKRELLEVSDVFVLPSEDESFGIAVAEAMACSVPVVVAPGVALSAEIGGADAGVVVPRTPDAVAAGILSLARDPAYARRVADAGRGLARSAFSLDSVISRLESVYESARTRRDAVSQ